MEHFRRGSELSNDHDGSKKWTTVIHKSMNADQNIIWNKLSRGFILLLIVAIVLMIGMWYMPLIRQNQRIRQENLRLDQEIQKEEAQQRQLKSSINSLQKDPNAIERMAREKLGYARPGETVIRFEAPATNSSVTP